MSETDYPIDLGPTTTLPATTRSPLAQTWYARGCAWASGFHREEASHCFSEAIKADPECCMAHWGLSLVNGPDYNFHAKVGFYGLAAQAEGFPSLNVATTAAARAVELAQASDSCPPREKALAQALATRYEWPITETTPELQERYADEMEKVAAAFADDADVQAVCAEALMCLAPWDLYEKDQTPKPIGLRIKAVLDRGLAAKPGHLWLCHLKMHYSEMGPVDSFDWHAANVVRASGTEVGHMIHMPTHLDIQAGDYKSAMELNMRAVQMDLKLHALSPSRFTIYFGYALHNMEFAAWAAMYAGCKATALAAVDHIDAFLTEPVLRSHPVMSTFNELFLTTRLMVLIRFGLWADILATPFKEDAELYLGHTLFLHYARGIALGATGDAPAGRAAEKAFHALLAQVKPDDRRKHNVHIVHMAEIASDVLSAELHYREGGFEQAFDALERGVARFDALPYDEPHGWLMSVRQTQGALLTEQGEHERAIAAYKRDLQTFPGNIWSLTGLRLCYAARADPRVRSVDLELRQAAEVADVPIGASCACALTSWRAATAADKCAEKSACCSKY